MGLQFIADRKVDHATPIRLAISRVDYKVVLNGQFNPDGYCIYRPLYSACDQEATTTNIRIKIALIVFSLIVKGLTYDINYISFFIRRGGKAVPQNTGVSNSKKG
ncbi:conserved hypothetical protein [Vibrio coralliirubri]|nr:conserved hypothetical protein [Vibrio coralliirubri]CDU06610.1 conserved hypothetical protein [Vibrio coralliirubri]